MINRIFTEKEWAELMKSVENSECPVIEAIKKIYCPEEITEQMDQDLGRPNDDR
jgi:hypothetical protein